MIWKKIFFVSLALNVALVIFLIPPLLRVLKVRVQVNSLSIIVDEAPYSEVSQLTMAEFLSLSEQRGAFDPTQQELTLSEEKVTNRWGDEFELVSDLERKKYWFDLKGKASAGWSSIKQKAV